MQAGGDLVNVVKQYNGSRLKDQNIKLAVGLLVRHTDITALGQDALAGTVYTTPWPWNMDDSRRRRGQVPEAHGDPSDLRHAGRLGRVAVHGRCQTRRVG